MNISLVFPPFYLDPLYNLPPVGLVSLATILGSSESAPARHITVFDFPLAIRQNTLKLGKSIYDDCADIIMAQSTDLVGFSVQCATYPPAVNIARQLKERRPSIKVVFGGHNASFADLETLQAFPWIDAVVRGEGEATFPELVASYERGGDEGSVLGVTRRKAGGAVRNPDRELIENLDDIPLPDYGFIPPLSEYRDACGLRRSIAILEVGRGCPHHCIYCSQSLMWRRRSRTFSVERLISEMRHLRDGFGAECFLLAYDQFTAKRGFVEQFCRRVIEEGLNTVPWYCISRLDSADGPLLRLMREAGCESMCYGIDSGSKNTLAFIRKNLERDILYRRVQDTTDTGIVPTLSYVIGFPEEETDDIDATLTLALMTGALGNVNTLVQMATVLPGTDLHRRYLDRLVRVVDTYFSLGIEFDNGKRLPSDEEMIDSDPAIFSSFYNLPCPGRTLPELNIIASFFHIMAALYPRSFLLLSMECGGSISGLFLQWLDWLKNHFSSAPPPTFGKGGGEDFIESSNNDPSIAAPHLSPQSCYRYFAEFAASKLVEPLTRPHIRDILRYETLAIDAAKFDLSESPFHIDLGRLTQFKPERSEKAVLGEFTFNIPDVILDIKAGIFREDYSPRRTFLLFRQEKDRLHVTEVNDFGVDLLSLCDGVRTIESISQGLYARYAGGMDPGGFYNLCVEAVQVLGGMKLFVASRPELDGEGG